MLQSYNSKRRREKEKGICTYGSAACIPCGYHRTTYYTPTQWQALVEGAQNKTIKPKSQVYKVQNDGTKHQQLQKLQKKGTKRQKAN